MCTHPFVYSLARRTDRYLYLPLVVTAILYLVTFLHHTYPGHAALLVAEAARLTPSVQPTHSLFNTFVQGIAAYDFFSLPTRLNLFSVLCGCLSAMLFYRLVARMIFFAGYDAHEDESEIEWPDEDPAARPSFEILFESIGEYNQRLLRIAIWSSLAGTLLLSLMAPFWLATTHLNEAIFNLALLLVILTLVPYQAAPHDHLRYLGALFLFTLGLLESLALVLLLPFMAQKTFVFYMRTENRGLVLFNTLFGGLAGVLISFAFRPIQPDALYEPFMVSLEHFFRAVGRHHLNEFQMFFGTKGWLASFLQVVLPAAILFFAKSSLLEKRNLNTRFLSFVILAVAVPALVNLPLSPFRVYQEADYLPLVSSAILVASLACVFAATLLFSVPKMTTQLFNQEVLVEGDEAPSPPSNKPAIFIFALFLFFAIITPLRSLPYVSASRSQFADALARNSVDSLGRQTWLITQGYLDHHLLIQAYELKKKVHLIAIRQRENPKERQALQRLIETDPAFLGLNRPRLLNAHAISTLRFISEWFTCDTNCFDKVAVFATPELWASSGYEAIPLGLLFKGRPAGVKLDTQPLIQASQTLATQLAPLLLAKKGTAAPIPARLSARLRLKMGYCVNELGTLLEGYGQPREAFDAYQRAVLMDPDNVSALLNAYALAKGGLVKNKQADALRQQLRQRLQNHVSTRLGLQGLFLNYGTIHQQSFYQTEAAAWLARGAQAIAAGKLAKSLDLAQQTGVKTLLERAYFYSMTGKAEEAEACYLAALAQDATDLDALYGMTILLINRGELAQAEEWLARTVGTKKEKNMTFLYPTILIALQKGDKEKSKRLLEEATTKFPKDERFWKLRAHFLLQQGDLLFVRHVLLPEMEKALQNADHYLVHVVRGLLLKQQGPSFYRESRISLLKGLSRNASMEELWNTVLELDMKIGNLGLIEVDLHHLLTLDPNHAQANYMKGSIQLARGKIASAEDFMRRSIEREPNALACNDLAEILRRQRKYEEAKKLAHQAISLDPLLPNARATLAAILAESEQENTSATPPSNNP